MGTNKRIRRSVGSASRAEPSAARLAAPTLLGLSALVGLAGCGTTQPHTGKGEPPPTILGASYNPPEPPQERIALLAQWLSGSEDDKKALQARLRWLEGQVEEKDRALAQANKEIESATAEIVRTRTELEQWRKDMQNLRDRLRLMEKENKETLEAVIKLLEHVLDREKDPPRPPEPVR